MLLPMDAKTEPHFVVPRTDASDPGFMGRVMRRAVVGGAVAIHVVSDADYEAADEGRKGFEDCEVLFTIPASTAGGTSSELSSERHKHQPAEIRPRTPAMEAEYIAAQIDALSLRIGPKGCNALAAAEPVLNAAQRLTETVLR